MIEDSLHDVVYLDHRAMFSGVIDDQKCSCDVPLLEATFVLSFKFS